MVWSGKRERERIQRWDIRGDTCNTLNPQGNQISLSLDHVWANIIKLIIRWRVSFEVSGHEMITIWPWISSQSVWHKTNGKLVHCCWIYYCFVSTSSIDNDDKKLNDYCCKIRWIIFIKSVSWNNNLDSRLNKREQFRFGECNFEMIRFVWY